MKYEQKIIQKLCSFCGNPLKDEDYNNPNDFYLACYEHKKLAKIEEEKYFRKNPDYTKWATNLKNKHET